ncbi:MAG TPA: hypothetical protein PL110_17850, partial [Candidatus Eremiobacteraeota bacterium]|nr:hypothetical protein [Candidatus Eremiobacteraeota bacterium]
IEEFLFTIEPCPVSLYNSSDEDAESLSLSGFLYKRLRFFQSKKIYLYSVVFSTSSDIILLRR